MSKDVREIMTFLAAGCEKVATVMEMNAQAVASKLPLNATEYDRGYIAGYTEGRIKSYRDMAEDLRKVLRDNPSSNFNWPRISLGFSWRF